MTLLEIIDWLTRINKVKYRMEAGDLSDKLREAAKELERLSYKVVP